MKSFLKVFFAASFLVTIVTSQRPKCTYQSSAENLYTCSLTSGDISPDDVVLGIDGSTDVGKTFDDVQKVVALGKVTEFILVSIFNKFKNLEKLELEKGVLENITSDFVFDCNRLQNLAIMTSMFEMIPQKTFSNCKALIELNLGGNQINVLNEDAFWNLENLKILRLNSNRLANVPASVFYPLTKLELLDLSKNTLKAFDGKIFQNNKLLKTLNFAENLFKRIPKDYFVDLKLLENLDVTNSGTNETEMEMFMILEGLKVAKFRRNICIDKDFDYFKQEDIVDFKLCIDNFNGASIFILSNLVLAVAVFLSTL